jgi:beta-lactamase regulating signal transducer with metallopeptidase domain
MTPAAPDLGWLAVALGEASVLLLVVWVVDRLTVLRVHPTVRHGLWMLVLVRLLLPPGLIRLPAVGAFAGLANEAGLAPFDLRLPAWGGGAQLAHLGPEILAVWLAGVSITACVWWRRTRAGRRRLAAASASASARVHAVSARLGSAWVTPRVAIDPFSPGPYVTGLGRPWLVLPANWTSWATPDLDHAIGHELVHLRRRDLWTEAAWMTATAAYWFHPLVHVARRRAHAAREACCDASAAARFGEPYRRSLLRLASDWPAMDPASPPSRHAWGPLVSRLKALERWPARRPARHRLTGALFVAASALVIVPSHALPADAATPPPSLSVDQLVDAVARQEAGLGSLHVRYELMRRANLERKLQ